MNLFRSSASVLVIGWVALSAASCSAERTRHYLRPVSVYVEQSSIDTDFDPRVLKSDGNATTFGLSYDVGLLFAPEPLTEEGMARALASLPAGQRIEQTVSVAHSAQQTTQEPEPYQPPVGPEPVQAAPSVWWQDPELLASLGGLFALVVGVQQRHRLVRGLDAGIDQVKKLRPRRKGNP